MITASLTTVSMSAPQTTILALGGKAVFNFADTAPDLRTAVMMKTKVKLSKLD